MVFKLRQTLIWDGVFFYVSVEIYYQREYFFMDVSLYVGNLSYNTTEDDLRTLFSQAGTVVSIKLITDRDTGRSKGFAFIEMTTQVEAEKAITLFNGSMMDERPMKVNIARPEKKRSSNRRGGYRSY